MEIEPIYKTKKQNYQRPIRLALTKHYKQILDKEYWRPNLFMPQKMSILKAAGILWWLLRQMHCGSIDWTGIDHYNNWSLHGGHVFLDVDLWWHHTVYEYLQTLP